MASTQPNVKTTDEPASGPLVLTDQLRIVQGDGSDDSPYRSARTSMQDIVDVVLANAPVGGVQTVQAGTNITIDNTDPSNPIVNSTASGGGSDPIDKPPTTPNAMDDEFPSSLPLDPKWVWVSQGADTVAMVDDHLVITSEVNGSDVVRCIDQPLPSGTVTCIAKAAFSLWLGDNFLVPINLRESATGKIASFGMYMGSPSIIVATGNVSGSYSSVPASASIAEAGFATTWWYFKVEIAGGNMSFSFSRNGTIWYKLFTAALTAVFTTAPDHIGFVTRTHNTNTPIMAVDFFRRTV